MSFESPQSGFEAQAQRLRRNVDGLEHADELVNGIAGDLAQMWKDNMDTGPNERWEGGVSLRSLKLGYPTLAETGAMKESIVATPTGSNEATVGSSLEVGDGYNLLALQEFGVDAMVSITSARRSEANPLGSRRRQRSRNNDGAKHLHIPRRPTSPFDWDAGELTPEAQVLVQSRVDEYLAGLTR